MKFRITAVISTFGPLHLIKSAEYLTRYLNVRVLQGWIPNRFTRGLLPLISKIVGRDISKTIVKRTPEALDGRNKGIALPEFYLWFCRFILKKHDASVALKSAVKYGDMSKRYIKNADIFHVRSGSGLGGAIEKAKKHGMKVVVDHSIAHPQFMENQLRPEFEKHDIPFSLGVSSVFWQGVLKDCEQADYLLVNSYFVRDTFVRHGYPSEKVKVVYLGVSEDFHRLKMNYDQRSDKIRILFTGSFGFRKGAEYLLQALRLLDNMHVKYEITVVGSYDEANTLLKRFPEQNIRFTGHIPQNELKEYLGKADIYLFPSLCEGCASSGMEAMAAGLPVITTEESGLPIDHLSNGYIIRSKNAEDIVQAISDLINDVNLRKTIGRNAAKTISEYYTWEHYARQVHMLYDELLKGHDS